MKTLITSVLFALGLTAAHAQFPGGPGGMPSGDGNGRSRNTNNMQSPTLNLEGTAPKGNSKITGFVIDSAATQAVEFANIALYSKATGKAVDGSMADDKGKFTLKSIAVGDYKLMISFIGFKDKTIDNIKIAKGQEIDLGVIKMNPDIKTLDEVVVMGEKSLIEEKVDRLVYNADKDLTARGGDAADVLKKVPMLSVDLDGNVSLRGSQNIRVLINNKPSTIVASSIADALKMIPADLIKSVEVITSPSAKYDAEGSAGIINIITKKSTLQGLTLNADAGVGARGSNLSLNGNYRQGKLGITLGGFGRVFYNKAATTLDQTTIQNGASLLTKQATDAYDNGLFGRYNLGFDYELSKTQSLSAGVSFGTRNMVRSQDMTSNLFRNNVLSSTTYRDVTTKDLSNNVDMNLDYIRTFKVPGREWSVSTQYSRNNLTNNFNADLLNESSALLSRQKNLNDNLNQEATIQTDYQTPIKKNQMIEFGAKTIMRQVNSNFSYLVAGPTGAFASDARNPEGLLDYSQSIVSGYLSYTYTTANKYTFKVGSRYEYTTIEAKDQIGKIAIPSYGTLVPSVNVSKTIKAGTTLKAAYNRRIQRPGLQQLNPNFNAANPFNINIGNPNLKPEMTNNFELSLSTGIKKTYLNASVFSRSTNNSIMRLSAPSDTLAGAIITTFQNIGKQQVVGANVFANVYLTPKWTLNGGVDVYYNYLEGKVQGLDGTSVNTSNSGIVIGGRVMSSLALNKGWAMQLHGGMRGNQVTLQGVQGSFYMYSFGVKKELNNKKGSIGLATDNFLGGMKMKSTSSTPVLNQTMVNNIYNQNIKVTFSYKIGKMTFVAPKKAKGVKNDDVKEGGDNN
ncbi:TonB-dependent receptor domain-containing protein [Runella slithyformis]|uniref:TonB-dependent receptor plug n=1 Tax=Runella slithyformis (strain ATCC 29530 / DSM 19594 / LMG 11500 / NCIMB 11436 / LSU 4) TaxID=761193 RepID=A0A7U3ZH57_RUNSL|nr:TonB-dependent receptor [Runella slithyformis]AEI47146.1 TonB-dependent receptor plug [Runella slithyformis DSM 19594]